MPSFESLLRALREFFSSPSTNTNPTETQKPFHLNIHLFTNFWSKNQTTEAAQAIKKIFLNNKKSTCLTGPKGTLKLGVQTEFILEEYTARPQDDALQSLGERLDALFAENLSVDLLLPIHNVPTNNWKGLKDQVWAQGHTFLPFKPTKAKGNPYDTIAEFFHLPVIQFLKDTNRLQKLNSLFVANEFGYLQGGESKARQEDLAATLLRVIKNAQQAVNSQTKIGIKLARLSTPETGWTPENNNPDQLAKIIQHLKDTNNIFAYDVYYEGNYYDTPNRDRLAPFLSEDITFYIGEFGRLCQGPAGNFPTTGQDINRVIKDWPEAQSLNVFAFYTGDCFSLAEEPTGIPYPSAQRAVRTLRQLITKKTGTSRPKPCNN